MIRALKELFLARRQSNEVWNPLQTNLGRDRRIFQRVPVRMAMRMDNRVFGLQAEGSLLNLSLGGAGLVAGVSWPEGSQVRVYLESIRFEADAIVVFRRDASKGATTQFQYGVKFHKMNLKKLVQLRQILKKHSNGPLTVIS